ncbi:hypothetical protein HAX54_044564, partial [Datura stramonium]|nr:hypothetical protein [Datura stramonium]
CERPFDLLRVKGAPGRGKKKRKNASAKGDGRASFSRSIGPFEWIEVEMAAMQELLGRLPRPPSSSRLVLQLSTQR